MEIKNSFNHADMEAARSGWFTCSCCPTNVVRLMPSIPGYVYAQKGNEIYANLFVSGKASLKLENTTVEIEQKNNYPWDGNLSFAVTPKKTAPFTLRVRIPGWAVEQAMPSDLYKFKTSSDKKVELRLNEKPMTYTVENGYAVLNRTWKKGDVVEMVLPMDVRRVTANEAVKDDLGKVALQRGPLVYCAESMDNNGKVSNMFLPGDVKFTTEHQGSLLNGVTVIKTEVPAVTIEGNNISTTTKSFVAIPYYAWAHRGKGEMRVWFPEQVKSVELISSEGKP
jgi:uncharacterized protein